ncbi:MAG: DUF3329 domain-containing protein [Rhizobiales bacterium]|nr:DUF3329 domain-containing protein [Hyphomicrobiales bacterium]MBI3673368.1 DUF3329 domain-containing protein [Hyphomicrobiales bacterium]
MQLIEPGHPFYKPLWRRLAIVAACALWLAFEVFVSRDNLFMPIAAALTAYTAWVLLAKYRAPEG